MSKLQQYTFVCAPAPLQAGVIASFETDMSEHVAEYESRRDMVLERLSKVTNVAVPGGAFYAFVDAERLGLEITAANAATLVEAGSSIKAALSPGTQLVAGVTIQDEPRVIRSAVCGDGVCATGETCTDATCSTGCAADCPVTIKQCPGTPVCGGLTTHQAMAILRSMAGINVVGMDVVEVAPAYDIGEITALAGAHLAMEMLYLYACRAGA